MQLKLVGRALAIFPLSHNKRPACAKWQEAATADLDEIKRLFTLYRGPLIGVPTGEVNGFDVLDVDAYKPTAALWYRENMGRIPPTRMHETKSGGYHFLFQHEPGLRCSFGRLLAHGVEVKADGGYVVWYPASGLGYADVPVAPWPEWLLALLQNRSRDDDGDSLREALARIEPLEAWNDELRVEPNSGKRRIAVGALKNRSGELASTKPGRRNTMLNIAAYTLARLAANGYLTLTEIVEALISAAKMCKLLRDDGEAAVRRTIVSGLTAGLQNPYHL